MDNAIADMDAVILVGGRGTRLRPLTVSTPKPMLPTAGYPFLAHLLARIKAAGMNHVVLGTSYKAEVFEEYFGDGSEFGLEIEYVVEEEALGTGGGERFRALVRTGHAEHLVAGGDQIIGDGRADPTGGSSNEHTHKQSPGFAGDRIGTPRYRGKVVTLSWYNG